MSLKRILYLFGIVAITFSCGQEKEYLEQFTHLEMSSDILNYNGTPNEKFDKNMLMFSDQGAWFAYSLPTTNNIGFSGPFLMTQENGVWLSKQLSELTIKVDDEDLKFKLSSTKSYHSHLESTYESEQIQIKQELVFQSGHSARIQYTLKNKTSKKLNLKLQWKNNPILTDGITFKKGHETIEIDSDKSPAIGYLKFGNDSDLQISETGYIAKKQLELKKETQVLDISHTFLFPEYGLKDEWHALEATPFSDVLEGRKMEKEKELYTLINKISSKFDSVQYHKVLAKAHLTLQNNWRIPAGEIKYEGLFPSYHYKWFNGFWSWDSWKHAVGLAKYNTELAKNQIRLMFEFQEPDGFVADCVYRDTSIEAHNYRDTKPPLSAWAVYEVYKASKDTAFVEEMYPKLKKYHEFWYAKRDHDKDSLCEYGSTDGSLVAAKWESGMDNAIRFDNTKILKNEEGAFSMDQESVDLNAYLFAEKHFLADLSEILNNEEDKDQFISEAETLQEILTTKFFSEEDGWFYDVAIDGNGYVLGAGSEGWTALWAKAATAEQASAIKTKMMNEKAFYTKVPFQTMSAEHPKFNPMKGYWRGPNWLDQSYFGVKSLLNYGYKNEAYNAAKKILHGAEGVMKPGLPIRENYHPLTGEGLYAKNFSWSAAHLIMLLTEEY